MLKYGTSSRFISAFMLSPSALAFKSIYKKFALAVQYQIARVEKLSPGWTSEWPVSSFCHSVSIKPNMCATGYSAVKVRHVESLALSWVGRVRSSASIGMHSAPNLTVGGRGIAGRTFPRPIVSESGGIASRAITSVGVI